MKKVVILFLTVFIVTSQIDASIITSDIQSNFQYSLRIPSDEIQVRQKGPEDYKLLLQTLIPRYLEDVLRWTFKPGDLQGVLTLIGVGSECRNHVVEWVYWLDQATNQNHTAWMMAENSTWILQMIDAWGKLPEGILSGHLNMLGDFDECTAIRAKNVIYSPEPTKPTEPEFRGRYCNIILRPKLPTNTTTDDQTNTRISLSLPGLLKLMGVLEGILIYPTVATCFPSTCSSEDVSKILAGALSTLPITPVLHSCSTDQKPDFVTADYAVMGLLGFIGALIVLGTSIDIVLSRKKPEGEDDPPPRKPGTGVQVFLAFSLKTNIRKLLNSQTGPGDFRCLHGIRFLSTMWVVSAHTWYVTTFIPMWNMVDVKTVYEDWTIMTLINSAVSVDTFFILSGLLVTFNVLKMLDRTKGRMNIPMFYIHRYLRLTPTYAILIGVMATLWPYLGSGPYWSIMDLWSQWCKDNWWTNLLYVNNLVHPRQMCYGEAWYLANDMQFYILSPLIIWPLWKWPVVGKVWMALITIGSVITPGLRVYLLGDPTTPGTFATRNMGEWFYSVNVTPWCRAQTYMVGMWMGYILYKTKGSKVRIPILVNLLGWIFALGATYVTLYSVYPYFDPDKDIPDAVAFLYASFNKFLWGVGVCWVMFACIHGYGGFVNTFLSWRAFVPLGRLTFSVYLISLHLQMILHLSFRQAITYDEYTMTNLFFAHAVMALLLGFLCTITVESPFIQLEKLILPAGGGSQPRVNRPKKRYGIFYNSNEVIFNSFDKNDEDENNVNTSGTEKPEV